MLIVEGWKEGKKSICGREREEKWDNIKIHCKAWKDY